MGTSFNRYAIPEDPQFFPSPDKLTWLSATLTQNGFLPRQPCLGKELAGAPFAPFGCEAYDFASRSWGPITVEDFEECDAYDLGSQSWSTVVSLSNEFWSRVSSVPSKVSWHLTWFPGVEPKEKWAAWDSARYPLNSVPEGAGIEDPVRCDLSFILLPDCLGLGHPGHKCLACSASLMDDSREGFRAYRECPECRAPYSEPNVVNDIEIDGLFSENTSVAFRFALHCEVPVTPKSVHYDEDTAFCMSIRDALGPTMGGKVHFEEYWDLD